MSYNKIFGEGAFYKDNTFAQLSATGVTPSFDVAGLKNHTFQVMVASINTNVILALEGSHDGTNFFEIPSGSQANVNVTGMTYATGRYTITVNGTYRLVAQNESIKHIRLRFVSETGGTTATLNPVYHGVN